MTYVYLAEPIDLALGKTTVANHIEANLRHAGRFVVYRPAEAWRVGGAVSVDPRLDRANRHILGICDAVVAVVLKGVQSVGVPMEIEYALNRGIPVVIVTDHHRSWALGGCPEIAITTDDPEKVVELVTKLVAAREAEASAVPLPVKHLLDHWSVPDPERPPGEYMPARTFPDDAGLDLYVSSQRIVPSGEFALLECGIAVELPPWSWGLILGRSSAMAKRRLQVLPAVIDAGWRGPLNVGVLNHGPRAQEINRGERIGQLIIMHNFTRQVTPVAARTLSDHPRGHNGFGSSGR